MSSRRKRVQVLGQRRPAQGREWGVQLPQQQVDQDVRGLMRLSVPRIRLRRDDAAGLSMAILTPALAFVGAMAGQFVIRKGARELDRRWHREETMRKLRWAADMAPDSDAYRSAVGVTALGALEESALLQLADQAFIAAALEAVVGPVVDDYGEGDTVLEVG